MTSASVQPHDRPRAPGSTGLGVFMLLLFVFAGLSRWELYLHAAGAHSHTSNGMWVGQDGAAPALGEHHCLLVPDLHDARSSREILPTIAACTAGELLPDDGLPVFVAAPVHSAESSPPFRPPIA